MISGVLGIWGRPDPVDTEIGEKQEALVRAAGISRKAKSYLDGAAFAREELVAAREELKRLKDGEPPYMELVEEGRPNAHYPHSGMPAGAQFSAGIPYASGEHPSVAEPRSLDTKKMRYSTSPPLEINTHEYAEFLKKEIDLREKKATEHEGEMKAREKQVEGFGAAIINEKEWLRLYFHYENTKTGVAIGGTSGGVLGAIGGSSVPSLWGAITLVSLIGGAAAGAYIGRRVDVNTLKQRGEHIDELQKTQMSCENERQRLLGEKNLKDDEIDLLKKELEGMMPELGVRAVFDKLIEETYAPVDLVVSNKGKGPAYDVECTLRGPIEGEAKDGKTNVRFKTVGPKEVRKTLSLKPTDRGKMRWIFEITYRDCVGRKHEEELDQWIDSAFFAPPTQVSIGQQIIGDVHGDVAGRDVEKIAVDNRGGVMSRTNVGGKPGN